MLAERKAEQEAKKQITADLIWQKVRCVSLKMMRPGLFCFIYLVTEGGFLKSLEENQQSEPIFYRKKVGITLVRRFLTL